MDKHPKLFALVPLAGAALILAGCASTPSQPLYQPPVTRKPDVPLHIGHIGKHPGYVTAAITVTPPQTPCDSAAYETGFRTGYALTWDSALEWQRGQLDSKTSIAARHQRARLKALEIRDNATSARARRYSSPPASLTSPGFCPFSAYQEGERDGDSAATQAWKQGRPLLAERLHAEPH